MIMNNKIEKFNKYQLPSNKTESPYFASGPVKKLSGWTLSNSDYLALLGRSHRSKDFMVMAKGVVDKLKQLFKIPEDYKVILTPSGATGAMETALWNMAGFKAIDSLVFDVFGGIWHNDIVNELKLENVNLFSCDYGEYPDIKNIDFKNNDVILTYSGSTAGMVFKDKDLIPNDRNGLIYADATSYMGFYEYDWLKFDVTTFSLQKTIAGEAGLGVLVLSPAAINRVNTFNPNRAMPSLFKIKKDNKINEEFLDTGFCVNTPSILTFIDADYNLDKLLEKGGRDFFEKQVNANCKVMSSWVEETEWIDFFVKEESCRSKVVMCLKFISDKWNSLDNKAQKEATANFLEFLAYHHIAFDISMHRKMPNAGLRIWLGPTIKTNDIKILTEWLSVAYQYMMDNI